MTQRSTGDGAPRRPATRAVAAVAVLAVLAVLAALVVVLVVRPGTGGSRSPSASSSGTTGADAGATPDPRLPVPGDLLRADDLRALGGPPTWTVGRTDANTAGNGLGSVCQQERYADPDGLAALVRTFRASGPARRTAVQSIEVSRTARQAARAFRTVERWYAGCRAARLQLLDAYRVDGVGDRAAILTLRIWRAPVTTVTVGLARTRSVTTSTVSTTVGRTAPGPRRTMRTLAASVARLCPRSGAPACVRQASYRRVPPPVAGGEAGVLAVADLPPVGRVDRPWVATGSTRFRADRPTTGCDRTQFFRDGAIRARTRTYLVPQAALPARFGLTESYGVFRSRRAAARFVAGIRASVAGCERRDLATRVGAERRPARGLDASAWDVATEVSASQEVRFRLGVVRVGRYAAQLTFSPSDTADMPRSGFDALVVRAGDRLREPGTLGR